ncbi:MAG TPA: TlpA disulfide reductase family protein, partial [Isosphaeraceae bacterium]|nr:TlpA disulfide reductase family protein [Isosphaeraceae bacterium]
RDLVVLRDTDHEADLASVQPIAPGPGRVHLQVYLDQERERILVFSAAGKALAELKVAAGKPEILGAVHLANIRGDVRLERLRISRWNGERPLEAQGDKPGIDCADGAFVHGQVIRFDTTRKEFIVRAEGQEARIPESSMAGVLLSGPRDDRPRGIRAVSHDGTRLSGELVKVEKGEVWMSVAGVTETLRLPLSALRTLVVTRRAAVVFDTDELTGVLEVEGLRLHGRLVDGRAQPGSSCLVWQPLGSATASPLRAGVSGRVVYREPARQTQATAKREDALVAVPPPRPRRQPAGRHMVYLRTGDIIPSEVKHLDEQGLWIRTALAESTVVPHDKLLAVELLQQAAGTSGLSKPKRERMLTVPRMQKESPPTHLIRSLTGDYVRGRVIAMDDKKLQVEVRLETIEIPRNRISRIIWLQPDEKSTSKDAAKSEAPELATRVQALHSDGIRLTFLADRLANAALIGKSDVLGPCQVRLNEVDQILIGDAIEKAAGQIYQPWVLHIAQAPKVASSDDGPSQDGRTPGTDSALVGKPAPDFDLELLEGKRFHLASLKGKVVMLDFWATWCGPCVQAMPQVDRVAHEFERQGVQLVAINLQETPKQISEMLERHKLGMAVALDKDGVVAARYNATAIPQTVIIDRDGNIARLFVGGGPKLGDQLRDALSTLLAGDDPAP